jgi:hemerythrin
MSTGAERLVERADERIAVGVPVLDAEHAIQLHLLTALSESVGRNDGRALELLDQFIDYTGVHFLSEQILMRLHSYPGYSDHLLAHERLLRDVRALRERVVSGQGALDQQLVASLRHWLVTHIEEMDRPLGAYLIRGGLGSQ